MAEETGETQKGVGESDEKPVFVTAIYGRKETRTLEMLAQGTIAVENAGLGIGVEINVEAFSCLLREEELTVEQINNLRVVFRSGSLADRNLYGGVIGGFSSGNEVEVYTSLRTAISGEAGVRFYDYPMRQEQVVLGLLHELGHEIQSAKGLTPPPTFMAGSDQMVERNWFEQDADGFAKAHLETAKGWARLKEAGPFEENTGKERFVGDLGKYGGYLNLDRRLPIIMTDNPVLYFEEEVADRLSGGLLSNETIETVIARGRSLVDQRQMGMAEFNLVVDTIARKSKDLGDEIGANLVSAAKYSALM